DQRRRRRQVAAVGPEVDAGQRDFLETGGGNTRHLAQQILKRNASRPSAGRGNDAVRARFGTAGLHAQRERGPSCDAWLDRRAAWSVATRSSNRSARNHRGEELWLRVLRALGSWSGEEEHHTSLVVVRDHLHDVRKRGNFVRPPRRVAAGDD